MSPHAEPVRLADLPDVIHIEQLARVLGLSARTIHEQERAGTFPIRRIDFGFKGRKNLPRRYAKAAVERWLERRSR